MVIWTIKSEPEQKGPRRTFIYLLTEQAERWVPKPHSRPKYKQIAFHCSIWLNPHLFAALVPPMHHTLWHLHLTQLGKANFLEDYLTTAALLQPVIVSWLKKKWTQLCSAALNLCHNDCLRGLISTIFNLHKTFSHFSFCNLTPQLQIN